MAFAGRLIAGVCGASYATTTAFIADITEPTKRAKAFGMVGAAFGIGFIVGPVLGGVCAHFGTRAPFFAAAALPIANVLYGYFVLPETLAIAKRRPFSFVRANPIGGLMALRRHPVLLGSSAVLFLHFSAKNIYPAIWAYYTIYRYGWDALLIGLSLAVFGVVSAITQGALVGPFIQRVGERSAATVCLVIECIAGVGFAFATRGWMIYALLPLERIPLTLHRILRRRSSWRTRLDRSRR